MEKFSAVNQRSGPITLSREWGRRPLPTADARRQRWSGRLTMTSVTRRVTLLPLRRRHACLRSPFAIGNPCYALLCSVPFRAVRAPPRFAGPDGEVCGSRSPAPSGVLLRACKTLSSARANNISSPVIALITPRPARRPRRHRDRGSPTRRPRTHRD